MSFYKYQSAIGDEIENEILFFKRKNTRASSFHHSGAILRLRKCGFLYTRFLTFMLISTMVFMWWKIMVCDCISVMRDGDEHPTSFVEASQERRSSKS